MRIHQLIRGTQALNIITIHVSYIFYGLPISGSGLPKSTEAHYLLMLYWKMTSCIAVIALMSSCFKQKKPGLVH
jgi:hypothetical protein